jgi:hypothetical protein
MTKSRPRRLATKRRGLILLIVLGMIAMFSLLAVTYVVSAGASRSGSRVALLNARNPRFTAEGNASRILKQVISGTNDQQSPFYKNDILGDVYGPNAIVTTFHTLAGIPSSQLFASTFPPSGLPETAFVKLTLNPVAESGGSLSLFENEYNSRVLTVLEGPLAGQSFRILKYVGYVPPVTGSSELPQILDPNVVNTPWTPIGTPALPSYVGDSNAESIAYSVLLDLNEITLENVTGQFYPPSSAAKKSVTLSLSQWLQTPGLGVGSLFYQPRLAAGPFVGFRCLINDVPFNSPGIGIEEVGNITSGVPVRGFGNIDSRHLVAIPRNSNVPKISPALLPDYDYLADSRFMAINPRDNNKVGVDGINLPRTILPNNTFPSTEFRLQGSSNEGIDVPDYRDFWLAHQSFLDHDNDPSTAPVLVATPSFHRPELINYISNLFGAPSSLTITDVEDMLRLIDMSSARIMSYPGENEGFNQLNEDYPRLSFADLADITKVQSYVLKHIAGPWDVDNDGDGVPDSVWIDPGLPTIYSPEGRRLKPLASVLIQDQDGRINMNAAGERSQGLPIGFPSTNFAFKRGAQQIPSGLGYGPAEISLLSFLSPYASPSQASRVLTSTPSNFSIFDDLYGARRSAFFYNRPISFAALSGNIDRSPGQHGVDDLYSRLGQREYRDYPQHGRLPGMLLSRTGGSGVSFDHFGNPRFVIPTATDANPEVSSANTVAHEFIDDKYEFAPTGKPVADDPFSLSELEGILRQFDSDAEALPQRLKNYLRESGFTNVNDFIYREATTRSGELRHPNIAGVLKTTLTQPPGWTGNDPFIVAQHQPPSFLRYIQWLHTQRYRRPSFTPGDDPELSYSALSELFPTDFANGLRMDLNRPFGDGVDNDGDGQVDEPQEFSWAYDGVDNNNNTVVDENGEDLQLEYHPSTNSSIAPGNYAREIALSSGTLSSTTRRRLAGRQILARNLYCLAQLIVPREHQFPGMELPGTDFLVDSKIRARAIAQWAVNVVDYRDADSSMTRFEYDIFPFGIGTAKATGHSTISARPAFWAPDHVTETFNSTPNKAYVGVVWGMEMPEALLSETLAFHDKKVRNTKTATPGSETATGSTDPHFDQYRFPQSSLFVEITNPRTTGFPTNTSLPGVPSSLYTTNSNGEVVLNLGLMAPASGVWGSQPVWRVAITRDHDLTGIASADRPASIVGDIAKERIVTHQQSYEGGTIGTAPTSTDSAKVGRSLGSSTNLEQYIGNGLVYNLSAESAIGPEDGLSTPSEQGFERFIWFGNSAPAATQPIPDILPSYRSSGTEQRASVYWGRAGSALLPGGGFLVVGPRLVTPIGSLVHKPFSSPAYRYPAILDLPLLTPTTRPISSPSRQRIDFSPNVAIPFFHPVASGDLTVRTYRTNETIVNNTWMSACKTPNGLICATLPPDNPTLPNQSASVFPGTDWDRTFPDGVGINISFPTPVYNASHPTTHFWSETHKPTIRLNTADVKSSRADETLGFGDAGNFYTTPGVPHTPPDSWVDLAATPVAGSFPDRPFDHTNSLIGSARYRNGIYENVRTAYLQRLADPEFPYDPFSNPYITVDWMSIDLTVFNGEDVPEQGNGDVSWDPNASQFLDDPTGASPPATPTLEFASRFKTGALTVSSSTASNPTLGTSGISYHSPVTEAPKTSFWQLTNPPIAPPNSIHPAGLNYEPFVKSVLGYDVAMSWSGDQASATTLGLPNVGYHAGSSLVDISVAANNVDASFPSGFGVPLPTATIPAEYRGATSKLQGLFWANRPYVSPYELAIVPATNPGSFGAYFSGFTGRERSPFSFVASFQASNAWNTNYPTPDHTNSYWAIPTASDPTGKFEADWPLLLEFVETQAPFADANRYARPDQVLALASSGNPVAERFLNSFIRPGAYGMNTPSSTRGPSLLAPFNKLPSYVAAGKVNLNTIAFNAFGRSKVLEALDFGFARGANVAGEFNLARTGYDFTAATAASRVNRFIGRAVGPLDPKYPTQFAGAFRPAMSSNLAPVLQDPIPSSTLPNPTDELRQRWGVESSLLRSTNNEANFVTDASVPAVYPSPLFRSPANDAVHAGQPFARLQRTLRLPNLVTGQSNVFSIWITVSLFEYDPINGFGSEYVAPNGQPVRERQFSIIDRTVPVGYRPGETLNSDGVILLQRRLQ